jgi:hypothetical protein
MSADLLPPFKSGFRLGHSAETAVQHILPDIFSAVDSCDFAAVRRIDLSVVADTVDYDVLLQRMQASFGSGEIALNWFRSYSPDRTQYVRRGSVRWSAVHLVCGVSQSSVPDPILFIL